MARRKTESEAPATETQRWELISLQNGESPRFGEMKAGQPVTHEYGAPIGVSRARELAGLSEFLVFRYVKDAPDEPAAVAPAPEMAAMAAKTDAPDA